MSVRNRRVVVARSALTFALLLFVEVAAAQVRVIRVPPPPPPPPPPPNPDQIKPLEQAPPIRLPDVTRGGSDPTQSPPVQTHDGNQASAASGTYGSVEGAPTTHAEVPRQEIEAEEVSEELRFSRSNDLEGLPVMGKLRRAHWP